ncbi:MAG: endolytic transglycosylase MltG, partial [Ectothiorhodospira sp.]
DSLEAVTHPAESDALFIVGRGDGTHHFSKTYREHREAVIRHQLDGDASRYGR